MLPISICVICKNEERHIESFLQKIRQYTKGYPVEIVVTDTGSTDRTVELAAEYADILLHFDWIGDFSAARNFCSGQASNEWILFLDCDENIEAWDMEATQKLMAAFPQYIGRLLRKNHFISNGADTIAADNVIRLFSKKLYHYEGVIHEQVQSRSHSPLYCFDIPLTVDHSGYLGTLEELQQKAQRNNELLFRELEKRPDDPYLYFQIGQSFNLIHDFENAVIYYRKAVSLPLNPQAEYSVMLVEAYGNALIATEQLEEALTLERFYSDYCEDSGFLCTMGRVYLLNNFPLKAVGEFVKATSIPVCRTEGTNSFIPRYHIGFVNELLGDTESALKLYQTCGSYPPAVTRIEALAAAQK